MYRNPALLDRVRTLPCALCGSDHGIQASHSNQWSDGKGRALKAHDYRVAALCMSCHAEIDQGRIFAKSERRDLWERAHRKTIGLLFERGMIGPT